MYSQWTGQPPKARYEHPSLRNMNVSLEVTEQNQRYLEMFFNSLHLKSPTSTLSSWSNYYPFTLRRRVYVLSPSTSNNKETENQIANLATSSSQQTKSRKQGFWEWEASLFYKALECRDSRNSPTQDVDVYSFGFLLLEILTGKTSFHDLDHEYGYDISRWVCAVREAETESGEELNSSKDKLESLFSIATACVAIHPENRSVMREVLKMAKDARAEAAVLSSFSSNHSPGRWSDTIQILLREDHMSI